MDFLSFITPQKLDMLVFAFVLALGLFIAFFIYHLWKNREGEI